MRRLNGGDVQFVYPERDWRHLHTMKVMVVDPTGIDGDPLDEVVAAIDARLDRLEPLRWLLTPVPGGIFHPAWRDLGEIDVADHVRRVTAPAPGDRRALCEVVSRVASVPLRRDRPLWELVVVDGLADGKVALALKLHHAVCDGTASLNLIETMAATAPFDPGRTERPRLEAEPRPDAATLVRDGARDLAALGRALPGMTRRVGRALVNGTKRRRAGGPQPATAFQAERTRYNSKLTAERHFALAELDLGRIRAVKDALGGTVNDVFLALTSAAVRGHLQDRGELPHPSLTAAVPMTIRHEVGDHPWGNFPSNLFVTLATDVDDPAERFATVAASAAAAKEWHDQRELSLMFDWMNAYPAWTAYTRYLPAALVRLVKRPSYSLVASNMRGPVEGLHVGRMPVTSLYSMGPLVQELGLNVTAWSYCDTFSVGIHCCRDHGGEPWDLAERFEPALAELEEAAGLTASRPAEAGSPRPAG